MNCATTEQSLAEWAGSGLMALTGPVRTPLVASRNYLEKVRDIGARLATAARHLGKSLPAAESLLTERAALMGTFRQGSVSAGGKSRILRAADGYLALTLARPEDLELVPAWLGLSEGQSTWEAIQSQVAAQNARRLAKSGQWLGLPVAEVNERPTYKPHLAKRHLMGTADKSNRLRGRFNPLILDFSSLWAGPLCSHILGLLGARVIKVESLRRPDGARSGSQHFFDLLHSGQEMLALDFESPTSRRQLQSLIEKADVVIEGSRPRAFEQLGLDPERCFQRNPFLTWISITAYGRFGAQAHRVGFGDDVAASAGLIEFDDSGSPCFVGDAFADPLTGLIAATAGLETLLDGGGQLIEATLFDAAKHVASAPKLAPCDRQTLVSSDGAALNIAGASWAINQPRARQPESMAAAMGHHTGALLAELL